MDSRRGRRKALLLGCRSSMENELKEMNSRHHTKKGLTVEGGIKKGERDIRKG